MGSVTYLFLFVQTFQTSCPVMVSQWTHRLAFFINAQSEAMSSLSGIPYTPDFFTRIDLKFMRISFPTKDDVHLKQFLYLSMDEWQ